MLMNTKMKRIFGALFGIALVPGMMSGMSLSVPADETGAVPAIISAYSSDDVCITCYDGLFAIIEGQEYVIALKGEEPDWSVARELDEDGSLMYTGLTPATEYTVYARVKGTDGPAVTTDFVTGLLSIETRGEPHVGESITIIPEPEDAQGLTWQWFYAIEEKNEYGDSFLSRGDAIEGATSSSYEFKETDLNKYYWVEVYKGEELLIYTNGGPVKLPIAPTVSIEGWKSGDEPNAPVVTGNTGNGEVSFEYVVKDDEDAESTTEPPTEPGEYTVYVYIDESGDYAYGWAEADFTISPADDIPGSETADAYPIVLLVTLFAASAAVMVDKRKRA